MLVVEIHNLWKNLAGDANGLLHGNLQSQIFLKEWAPIKAQSSQCEVAHALQGPGWRAATLVPVVKVAASKRL